MTNEQWIRKPMAPPAHIAYAHKLGRGMLTFEQIDELVKAINPAYVETKQRLTYLAQHQARAEMNRIFGYGNWEVDAGDPFLLYEMQQEGTGKNAGKMYWLVAYRIKVTVTIRDLWGMEVARYTGVHAEENAPQPNRGEAHALALTSVDSYALRRALINLGDRFGLGLYNGGSTAPHGQYSIQQAPGQLFDWVDANTQKPATQAPVPVVTHETIQAEPAVPEYRSEEEAGMAAQAQYQQQIAQNQVPQESVQQAMGAIVQDVVSMADGGQPTNAQQGMPRSPQMQQFHQVQQGMQQQRQAEHQQMSPAMQARLQAGLKTDGAQG